MFRTTVASARRFLWTATSAPGVSGARKVASRQIRSVSSEALSPKPIYYHSFGILKVLIVSSPFVYIGAFGAKTFASWLEDFDLFVPDDDDD